MPSLACGTHANALHDRGNDARIETALDGYMITASRTSSACNALRNVPCARQHGLMTSSSEKELSPRRICISRAGDGVQTFEEPFRRTTLWVMMRVVERIPAEPACDDGGSNTLRQAKAQSSVKVRRTRASDEQRAFGPNANRRLIGIELEFCQK